MSVPLRIALKSIGRQSFVLALLGLGTLSPAQAGLFDGDDAHIAVVCQNAALRNNILAFLAPEEVALRQNIIDRVRLEKRVREAASALGYFSPTIDLTTIDDAKKKKGDVPPLLFIVKPGPATTIADVKVTLLGEGKNFEPFLKVLKTAPKVGTVLNQGDYDAFKTKLTNTALAYGFFNAHFTQHQLGVEPTTHKAYWDLTFDTGHRWTFGELTINDETIAPKLVRALSPFKAGDPYESEKVADYTRRLNETGWFTSALVAPEPTVPDPTKALPMEATLVPREANALDFGLGYSSDVGPRTRVAWTKPRLNPKGWSLVSETTLSKPEQTQDLSLKVPVSRSPLTDYWLYQGGAKRTDLNDTRQDHFVLGVSRLHTTKKDWQLAAGLRFTYDRFIQGEGLKKTKYFIPSVSAVRTRTRGGLNPTWGDTQRYTLEGSLKGGISDTSFVRARIDQAWLRSFGSRHAVLVRGTLGAIWVENKHDLPPDLRFFAGGDNSIRGFDYQKISPKSASGHLTGGRYLATASLEYRYRVTGPWWAATFVDTGDAFNTFKGFDQKTGVGVGVRWTSPIGPIKFDLARAISEAPTGKYHWKFYIGLGAEL